MTVHNRVVAVIVAAVLSVPALAFAQDPQTATPPQGQQRGPRGQAGRGLPPIGRGMNAQQLQAHLDAFALVQAEQALKLSADQYPTFVAKLTRLHNVRRRLMQERRRLLAELGGLLNAATPSDEAIIEKLRAFEDASRRGADELQKSYHDVDSVLTPWQRGRFRLFEDQLERRKLELLAKIGPPAPNPGK